MKALRNRVPLTAPLALLAAAFLALGAGAPAHGSAAVQAAKPPKHGKQAVVVPAPAPQSHLDQLFSTLVPWRADELGLTRAHAITAGSPGVTVAVVDTGVAPVPDLSGALLPGADFVGDGAGTSDPNGHGTSVALAVRQVCNCAILPVRVIGASGRGPADVVAQGITWAVDHGASIVNLSLSIATPNAATQQAVALAVSRGVLVVAAAGNDASFVAPYLASLPGVLSVGANDQAGNLAGYSNRGDWVDVAAPGCSVSPYGSSGNVWTSACGTSFAAPAVSGAAGLALTLDHSLDGARLTALLERTALPEAGVQDGRVTADGLLASLR